MIDTPPTEASTDTRSRWGRVRFGSRRVPAMAVALPVGFVLALGAGAISIWTGIAGPYPLVGGGVMTLVMATGFIMLVWALIVDRMTLQGAQERPDESIESTWLNKAIQGSFTDTIALTGLALGALAITGYEMDAMTALIGVILVAIFSTAIRYLVAKTRG